MDVLSENGPRCALLRNTADFARSQAGLELLPKLPCPIEPAFARSPKQGTPNACSRGTYGQIIQPLHPVLPSLSPMIHPCFVRATFLPDFPRRRRLDRSTAGMIHQRGCNSVVTGNSIRESCEIQVCVNLGEACWQDVRSPWRRPKRQSKSSAD